jgi:hypothetical protein
MGEVIVLEDVPLRMSRPAAVTLWIGGIGPFHGQMLVAMIGASRAILASPDARARKPATGRNPLIATLVDDAFPSTGEEFFEFGLQCLFDGLDALVGRREVHMAQDR